MDLSQVLANFISFAIAPALYPEMFWIILPLIVTMVLVELYMGRYKDEEFGGNSRLTNSLVYVFVGLDLLRKLTSGIRYVNHGFKLFIALVILVVGLALLYISFYHRMKIIYYIFNSVIITNSLAYILVVYIYGNMRIDAEFFAAAAAFIFGLWVMFSVIRFLLPKPEKSI